MARDIDLMGLGMPYALAGKVAINAASFTAVGATQPSAAQLTGQQAVVAVISTNVGNYVNLPSVALGGTLGSCLLGDEFIINNQTAGSIIVTASAGVNFSFGGASTVGTTGVSVSTHTSTIFFPVTSTSWIGVRGA